MKSLKFMIISFISLLVFSGGIFLLTHDFSPVTNNNNSQIEKGVEEADGTTGSMCEDITINNIGVATNVVSVTITNTSPDSSLNRKKTRASASDIGSAGDSDGTSYLSATFTSVTSGYKMYLGAWIRAGTISERHVSCNLSFSFSSSGLYVAELSGARSFTVSYAPQNAQTKSVDKTTDEWFKNGNTLTGGWGTGGIMYDYYTLNCQQFTGISLNVNNATTGSNQTVYGKYNATGLYSACNAISPSSASITAPSRTGYTFGGWQTSENGGTLVINSSGTLLANKSGYTNSSSQWTSSSTGVTLYANWVPNVYKVTLDNQSATSAGTTKIYEKYNTGWYSNSGATTSISSITIPTKTGYTFGGYYTSKNGGGTQIIDGNGAIKASNTTYTSTVTLYAKWTANVYTVSLDKQGATTAGTTTIYEKYNTGWYSNSGATSSMSSISVPVKIGYTFGGYYTSTNGGGTQIINASGSIVGANTAFTSNTTLYAKWTVKSVTLTLNANGGSFTNNANPTYQRYYGETITALPAPNTPKTGYHFGGWYANFTGSNVLNFGRAYMYTNALSVHLDAYMSKWGKYNDGMRLISCTEGGGFNIESNGGKIQFACYDSGKGYKVATASKTWESLTDGWHSFDLVFTGSLVYGYVDGVQVANSVNYESAAIGYCSTNSLFVGAEAGGSDTTPADSYFNGYIGNVIIKNQNSRITTDLTTSWTYPADNVTLYARWIPNTYSISYTLNDGSYGTYHPTTATYDTAFTVSNPSRTGYAFAGWTFNGDTSTAKYGTTDSPSTSWSNQSTKVTSTYFKNLTPTNNGSVTLTANWTPKVFTITLNRQGGSGGTSNIYEKYDTGYYMDQAATKQLDPSWSSIVGDTSYNKHIQIPTKNGYVFGGYYLSTSYNDSEQYIDSYGRLRPTSYAPTNHFAASGTLYAKWVDTWANHKTTPTKEGEFYLIDSAEKLAWFMYQVNFVSGCNEYKAKQTSNINMYSSSKPYYWYPIGTNSNKFSGVYDGQGYEISNYRTYAQTNDGVTGLFGYVSNSTIKNVYLKDVNIKGGFSAGGLVGKVTGNAVITSNIVMGSVSDNINDSAITAYVGGIVGSVSSGSPTINTNIFNGSLTKQTNSNANSKVGLICGYYTGKISDCLGVSSQTGLILNPSGSRENCMSVLNNTASYSSNGGQTDSFTNWQTAPEGMFAPKLPKALFWIANWKDENQS